MAPPLKAAVVGVGYLGRFHAQKYAALPDCELVAVVDANPARAREVGAELGVAAETELAAVLPRVDLVSIAATTATHHALGLRCLAAGKHVLMEKPLAATAAEAAALVTAARTHGVLLQVGHLERFNPAFQAVRERVRRVQFIEAIRISSFLGRGSDVDVVLDLMSHDLDLVLSLVDSPLADLHAVGISLLTASTDLANVRLLFENGATANLTASRMSAKAERTMRIFQSDAYVAIDFAKPAARIYKPRADAVPGAAPGEAIFEEQAFAPPKGDALLAEIESFLAVIRQGGRPVCSGDDGLRTVACAERVIQAIAEHGLP